MLQRKRRAFLLHKQIFLLKKEPPPILQAFLYTDSLVNALDTMLKFPHTSAHEGKDHVLASFFLLC